jgi:hypothetical protein
VSDTSNTTATPADVALQTLADTPADVALQTLAGVPVEDNTLPTITSITWSTVNAGNYVTVKVESGATYSDYYNGMVYLDILDAAGNVCATSGSVGWPYSNDINLANQISGLSKGTYTVRGVFEVPATDDASARVRYSTSTLTVDLDDPAALTISNVAVEGTNLTFDVSAPAHVSYISAQIYYADSAGNPTSYAFEDILISADKNGHVSKSLVDTFYYYLLRNNAGPFYLKITAYTNNALNAKNSETYGVLITADTLEQIQQALNAWEAPQQVDTIAPDTLQPWQTNLVSVKSSHFNDVYREEYHHTFIKCFAVDADGEGVSLGAWTSDDYLYAQDDVRTISLSTAFEENYLEPGTYRVYLYVYGYKELDDGDSYIQISAPLDIGSYTIADVTVAAPQHVTYENGVVHVADTYDYPVYYKVWMRATDDYMS